MKTILKNVRLLDGNEADVVICDKKFDYIGKDVVPGKSDKVTDCKHNLLMPAFYNTHCHSAMTLFRGYGDDLPLKTWLDQKILPAEDRLTYETSYNGALLACAEMMRGGVVSFSDMYMFEEATADAVTECGMKANISRCLVSFDENIDASRDSRLNEAIDLYKNYNNSADGRIIVNMSLHAQYTNVPKYCLYVSDLCHRDDIAIEVHLDETQHEHERCLEKYSVTPTAFLAREGVFDGYALAAHCVWLDEQDMDILAEKKVNISHNPSSNLKLGSGIMPYSKLKAKGLNISLGTDGAASNNNLSIIKEMQLAALLHKGMTLDATEVDASEIIRAATVNGAKAQRRYDCGEIKVGNRADCVLIDLDSVNNLPSNDLKSAVVYSMDSSNVIMTLCDGRIIYENNEYKSIDIERVKYNFKRSVSQILGV